MRHNVQKKKNVKNMARPLNINLGVSQPFVINISTHFDVFLLEMTKA
jgi:hypothetical protein